MNEIKLNLPGGVTLQGEAQEIANDIRRCGLACEVLAKGGPLIQGAHFLPVRHRPHLRAWSDIDAGLQKHLRPLPEEWGGVIVHEPEVAGKGVLCGKEHHLRITDPVIISTCHILETWWGDGYEFVTVACEGSCPDAIKEATQSCLKSKETHG